MKAKIIITTLAVVGITAAFGFSSTEAATNSGNGAGSVNKAFESRFRSLSVGQHNTAYQTNTVGVQQNAGKNKANKNTGGDVAIAGGDTDVEVGVGNAANQNEAEIANCDCVLGEPATASNTGNGANSKNTAKVWQKSTTKVQQTNKAVQQNTVLVNQNTGGNQANSNTGGSVEVGSGNSSASILIENVANSNSLVLE